jgi:hypothetical protein
MDRRIFIRTTLASAAASSLPSFGLAKALAGIGVQPNATVESSFYPSLSDLPALPAINWAAIGAKAPTLETTPSTLPTADVVVIAWAESEWAAMQHVFVESTSSMPYSDASTSSWSGWVKYSKSMPSAPSSDDWTYWGYYRLVLVNGKRVLLFKSNTHLDWPGQTYLADLINVLCQQVKPSLILSTGTAGLAITWAQSTSSTLERCTNQASRRQAGQRTRVPTRLPGAWSRIRPSRRCCSEFLRPPPICSRLRPS